MGRTKNGRCWVARGCVGPDWQSLDGLLLDRVWPLADRLLAWGSVHRWYSSRREPGGGPEHWRARLYVEVNTSAKSQVLAEMDETWSDLALTVEARPDYDQPFNWDRLQEACEVARELLPGCLGRSHRWRLSTESMDTIEDAVLEHPHIHEARALHWLENNLGLDAWELVDELIRRRFGSV